MLDIPKAILTGFMERLEKSTVPPSYHAEYLQWLRYYLDFSARFPMPDSKAERVRLFCEKLKTKNRGGKGDAFEFLEFLRNHDTIRVCQGFHD